MPVEKIVEPVLETPAEETVTEAPVAPEVVVAPVEVVTEAVVAPEVVKAPEAAPVAVNEHLIAMNGRRF